MSLIFLTAALGLLTTGLVGIHQDVAVPHRSFFTADAKSWLGFLVLLGLAVYSFTTAIVNPEQIIVSYG
jgi:uncharacterized membrane protein YozB (DUF420 family)